MQNFTNPRSPTLAITYNTSISSSATVTFNAGTTYIEVTAIDKGIFMKWNGTASSSSFDEFIGLNQTRTYILPAGVTTAQFIQETTTAKLVVIEK